MWLAFQNYLTYLLTGVIDDNLIFEKRFRYRNLEGILQNNIVFSKSGPQINIHLLIKPVIETTINLIYFGNL